MTDSSNDRRRERRRPGGEDLGIVSARVRPGFDVELIDVSSGGALIESARRLLPGTTVELHLAMHDRRVAVRGRVLRCSVSRLRPSSVCYRGAIGFDRRLPWLSDDDGYGVHSGEVRPGVPARAEATPQVL